MKLFTRASLAAAVLGSLPLYAAGADLTRSQGVLGTTVDYALQADPGALYLLLPSLSAGPTPLAIVDPLDARVLAVGIELVELWKLGVLDGAGQGAVSYPLPADAALVGIALHAQFVTLPGVTTLVQDVSDATAFVLGLPGSTTFTVGEQLSQQDGHGLTLLGDGRVLLTGGLSVDALGAAITLSSARLFDPQTQAFSAAPGALLSPRSAHTATLLPDGRVLLLGGVDANQAVLASGELYNPLTGVSTATAPMSSPRTQHTATLLADGRVLVAGGVSNFDLTDPIAALNSALSTTRLYTPSTNSWSNGPNMPDPLVGHQATRLGDGKVLISGGIAVPSLFGIPLPSITNACRRYNPATNSFQATASFSGARAFHGQLTLSNGNALVAGGADGDLISLNITALSSARIYNALNNTWSNAGSLISSRAYPQLVLAGSKVIALGGLATIDITGGTGAAATLIESAPQTVAAWTAAGNALYTRPLSLAAAVDAGQRVLITGTGDNGSGGAIPDLTAEIFIP